jgi:phytoene synthase
LFAIDDALGEAVARSTEPALAAIKLAWWRERLAALDQCEVPAEPRLQAAADELLTRSITGTRLAELEGGWAALLAEQPDVERVAGRGAKLFEIASDLLGASDPLIDAAGRLFASESVARRGIARMPGANNGSRCLKGHRFGRRLRPLTGLAALAARDEKRGPVVEPEGTPGRALTLLKHRVTGRIG